MTKRVAVTGGAGFIGSHTVEALVDGGWEVLVIDDMTHACGHVLPDVVDVVTTDCGSDEAARALVSFAPDAVLHLAAKGGVARAMRDPGAHIRAGLASTVALFAASCAAGARRVVTASSGGTVYGDATHLPADEGLPAAPRSPYGTGKYCEEIYLEMFTRLHGISGMPLRYANVYGPRQDGTGEAGVVAITCTRLGQGLTPIVFGDGTQARDFVYVGDVARANVAALESDRSGPVNVGTGSDLSVRDLVESLCQLYGADIAFETAPARPGEVRRTCLDPSRAKDWLAWAPVFSREDGLSRTKDYFAGT